MSRKTDIKSCRYVCCPHGKKIDISKDNYKLVGKTMYYHDDCLRMKQSGDWKDEKTKADLQYIKNQWVLHINNTVIYSQLFRVLNDFLARGIPSDYLVFVLDYVIEHNMKLNYPKGLEYYIDKQEIKDAYKKSKLGRIDRLQFTIDLSEYDNPVEVKQSPKIGNSPKGFASILQGKKQQKE